MASDIDGALSLADQIEDALQTGDDTGGPPLVGAPPNGARPGRPRGSRTTGPAAASTEPPPGPHAAALDPAVEPREGQRIPTKARAVVNEQEHLRIVRVGTGGAQEYVGDYRISDVSAAGDVAAFIGKYIAPRLGGGEYHVHKHLRSGGMAFQDSVRIPETGPGGFTAPGVGLDGMASTWSTIMATTRQEQEAADRRAKDAETARRADMNVMLGLVSKQKEGERGGMDPMMMMMLMKMMDRPAEPAVPASSATDQMLQQMMWQQQMAAMSAPPAPPPLPPPVEVKTPLDVAGLLTGIAAIVAPIATGVITTIQQTKATPSPWLAVAPLMLATAKELGLIGGERTTRADVEMAAIRERLAMMTEGDPPPDPLDQITRMVTVMDLLRPKTPTSGDWVALADRALDRMPDIVKSFAEAARGPADGTPAPKMIATAGGANIPLALVDMRTQVLAVPANAPQEEALVVKAVLDGLSVIFKAGGKWKGIANSILQAAIAPDVAGVIKAFNQLVNTAWPQPDTDTRRFQHRVAKAYRVMPTLVANVIRKNLGMPQLPAEPVTENTPTATTAPRAHATARIDPVVQPATPDESSDTEEQDTMDSFLDDPQELDEGEEEETDVEGGEE